MVLTHLSGVLGRRKMVRGSAKGGRGREVGKGECGGEEASGEGCEAEGGARKMPDRSPSGLEPSTELERVACVA